MLTSTAFEIAGARTTRTLCETAREEAFTLMAAHARQLGANAAVGVRYDTGPMVCAAEVLCYGTAFVVEMPP